MSVREFELAQKWATVVEAAGMRGLGQDPACLILLGGAIINNPVVLQRRLAKVQALLEAGVGYQDHPRAPALSIQVLHEMTPSEKVALKNAIVNTHSLNRAAPRRPQA
jgi:hypothetical protein